MLYFLMFTWLLLFFSQWAQWFLLKQGGLRKSLDESVNNKNCIPLSRSLMYEMLFGIYYFD